MNRKALPQPAANPIYLSEIVSAVQRRELNARYGVNTIQEANKLTDDEILAVKAVGKIALQRIRNYGEPILNNKHTSPCLQKAGDNEPVFALLGRDYSSPRIILLWMAENCNSLSEEKLNDAFETAKQMLFLQKTTRKYPS